MSDNEAVNPWGPPPGAPPSGPPVMPPSGLPSVPPPAADAASLPSLPPVGSPPPPPLLAPNQADPGPGTQPQMTFETLAPTPPAHVSKHRRSKRAVAGIAAGVLAIGGAGVFAVGQLSNDNSGGADSPDAVGTQLMSALEAEDVLGMVDLLLPGERDVFREPLVDIVSELSRLEILSAGASLSDLSGLDIALTDESVTVEPTNVDDISNITMTADVTASLDGEQLPIGDFVTDLLGDDFDPNELDQPETTEDFNLPMTVVEEDGRWYLSLFHTAAEAARAETGELIPEVGLEPRGGASPEGAVDALLDGVEQLDLGKFIAGINPNEAAALQRYAPLFLDEVDQLAADVPLDWQVTNTQYSVEGDGSKRFVTVEALRIDGVADGSTFSIELTRDCLVAEAEGERVDTCELDEAQQGRTTTLTQLDEMLGVSLDLTELVSALEDAFADYEQPGLTVQEVDGQWFVSPLGSGFDQFLAILRALDRTELDRIVDAGETFFKDLESQIDGGLGDFSIPGGDVFSDGEPIDIDESFDPMTEDDFEAEQRVANDCMERSTVDDITTCLTGAVERGELPDYYVGIEIQYPECGLAAVSLGVESQFDMSAEDYTAMIETASTCFGDLIARGEIDEVMVSTEYLMPECAEGQNPWSTDDEELFDRWIECIYG